jgi:hypothetical protein
MTTPRLPNLILMLTANSRAGSMHALTTEATQASHAIVSPTRWSWGRRRIHFLLRNFGRALAFGLTDVRRGPLKALHDSRSLLAARVIGEHRHLIQEHRCIGVLHGADDASLEP